MNASQKGVDFQEIFESSEGILEKREQGYTTEDGFIRLKTRPGHSFKLHKRLK